MLYYRLRCINQLNNINTVKKINYRQFVHLGNMPIRALQTGMASHIEKCRGISNESLSKLISNKTISNRILLTFEKEQLKTPVAYIRTKEVAFHEAFLSYIWVFCYTFLVILESSVKQKETVGKFKILNQNTPIVSRAIDLLHWAISLKDGYSEWPIELANPESYLESESHFVTRANVHFFEVISFFFYHEYSHLTLNHLTTIESLKKKNKKREIERIELITLENEADANAVRLLLGSEPTELHTSRIAYSSILAICSTLFLKENPRHLVSSSHPDHDSRIVNMYQRFQLQSIGQQASLQSLISISFATFASFNEVAPFTGFDEDVEVLIDYYLNEFSVLK